jgi:hypothetical protein
MNPGGLTVLLVHEGLLKHSLGHLRAVLHLIGGDLAACGGAAVAVSVGGSVNSHDFTSDTATMRCLANRRKNGADSLHNAVASLGVTEVHRGLYNVVRKGISQHLLKLIAPQNLVDHLALHEVISSAKTLLNHVRAEFLL